MKKAPKTASKIAIMTAYAAGVPIQFLPGSNLSGGWLDIHPGPAGGSKNEPGWDWIGNGYRIKPGHEPAPVTKCEAGERRCSGPDTCIGVCDAAATPAPEPAFIDWADVDQRFTHLAQDANGRGYLFTAEPTVYGVNILGFGYQPLGWSTRNEGRPELVSADVFASYVPGGKPWMESIVARPRPAHA